MPTAVGSVRKKLLAGVARSWLSSGVISLLMERKRLGFTQAGLAEIMGVSPGRVSQIEHGEVATVEALATYVAALGGKLELVADIGGAPAEDACRPSGLTM